MSILTDFLKLFKYNPEQDGENTFNIEEALNENWDKIDAETKKISDNIGDIEGLSTDDKENLVAAVNEVKKQNNNLDAELNTPDSTVPLTQQSPIFSVGTGKDKDGNIVDMKDSVIEGQVLPGLNGISAQNIVKNGNVVDASYWQVLGNVVSNGVENNEYYFTAGAQNGRIYQGGLEVRAGEKWFIKADVKATSNLVRLGFSGFTSVYHTGSGNYESLYILFTSTDYSSGITVEDMRTTGFDEIRFKNVMAIDLGADNTESLDTIANRYPEWFDGLASASNFRIVSRGKNLFDGDNYNKGKLLINDGTLANDTNNTSDYIRVKPLTQYIRNCTSITTRYALYDSNKNFISYGIAQQFATTNNTTYVRCSFGANESDDFQLEEGTVATEKEEYKESISYVNGSLRSLPNDVFDDEKIQRIEKHIFQSGDFYTLLNGTNNQWVTIPLTKLEGIKAQTTSIDGSIRLGGYTETIWSNKDVIGYVNHFFTDPEYLVLIFSANTYVNISEVEADLVDTKKTEIYYQLAEPIQRDLNITPITVYPNGTISIESDEGMPMPKFITSYPINQAATIASLNAGMNQVSEVVNSKVDKDVENWIDATLQNGWTGELKYRKNQIGQLEIKTHTHITPGTLTTGAFLAILPAGYRPIIDTPIVVFNFATNRVVPLLSISVEGEIRISNADTGIVAGNNLRFSTTIPM